MNINFDRSSKLEDIQNHFGAEFPYLKLVFGKPANNYNDLTIGDLNNDIQPGYIAVTDNITVLELEKLFSEMFGLPVRVQRKSGNIWMETSITNSWTLAQQNEHAKEISRSRIF